MEQKPVVINKVAMMYITDIAIDLFKYSTGPVNDRALLFQALSDYMKRLGVEANFTVKL